MTARRKRVLIGAGVVLLLLLAVFALRRDAIAVESEEVSTGPVEVAVESEGATRVRDLYRVAAPMTGVVSRTDLEEGDSVAQGQVVARVSPVPLDAQAREQARAQLDAAQARRQEAETALGQARGTLEQTQRSAERTRALFAEGAASREQLDQAELALATQRQQYEAAQARVRAAAAEIAAIRATLAPTDPGARPAAAVPVRSPVSGRVLRVHERSQRAVSAGTPLLDLGDAGNLEIVADVLSSDAVRVRAGQPLVIRDWGGTDDLRGTVEVVSPAAFTRVSALGVEERRVQVIGRLADPPPGLGHDFRVTVRIVVWESPRELRVPVAALFQREGGWHVFRIENGRARLRAVRIGMRGDDYAQVVDGLAEGDRVILYPSDRVEDGVAVS